MDLHDVEAVERAEAELDLFINKRSKAKEKANAEEAMYAESVRRFHEKRWRQEVRDRFDYHDRQLASHKATFGQLDAYHRGERSKYAQILGIEADDGRDDGPEAA